jgi:glutathione S-transferase
MLKLYDGAVSPCCMKVRLCLAEKNLDAELIALNLGDKANLEPEYLALNPKGVVPTLLDDAAAGPIIESTLINEYLDERFPEPALKPESAEGKAKMRLWTKFVDEELHPANGAVVWPILSLERLQSRAPDEVRESLARHPDPKRVARQLEIFAQGYRAPVVGVGLKVFVQAVDKLETSLNEAPYLAGEAPSLADFALLPYVNEIMNFGLVPLAAGKPRIADWFARMTARPSYTKAITDALPAKQWDAIRSRGEAGWTQMRLHLD